MLYSPATPELDRKIQEYCATYDEAERALKAHELDANEGLSVPALNEFRCAGRHFVRAISANDLPVTLEEVEAAINHLRRAAYDAYDVDIFYFINKCDDFRKTYSATSITPVISSFVDDCLELDATIEEMKEFAIKQRSDSTGKELPAQWLHKVKKISRRWELSREELNKNIRREKRRVVVQWLPIILAIIAIIVAWVK
jgi:hypothetical protein